MARPSGRFRGVCFVGNAHKEFSATGNKPLWSDLCEKTYWGWGMSPREFIAFYQRCAVYCLEIAQDFEDPGCKAALLSMAQTWRTLADQVQRAGGATHGISHPQSDEPRNGGCHCHG